MQGPSITLSHFFPTHHCIKKVFVQPTVVENHSKSLILTTSSYCPNNISVLAFLPLVTWLTNYLLNWKFKWDFFGDFQTLWSSSYHFLFEKSAAAAVLFNQFLQTFEWWWVWVFGKLWKQQILDGVNNLTAVTTNTFFSVNTEINRWWCFQLFPVHLRKQLRFPLSSFPSQRYRLRLLLHIVAKHQFLFPKTLLKNLVTYLNFTKILTCPSR